MDLLVVVDDALDPWSVRRSLEGILFDLLLESGRLVSAIVIPQSTYEGYRSPFLIHVRQEEVRV